MAMITDVEEKTMPAIEITENIVYLTDNITNIFSVLVHLIQEQIITEHEKQLINSEKTCKEKAYHLFSTLQRKNWPEPKPIFLEILRKTGNQHCAVLLEETPKSMPRFIGSSRLCSKWWPEEKTLPKAFHERKSEKGLLTAKLKEMLTHCENEGMAVITQKVTVSGLGGVGKTATAIWFAHVYKNEYDHILWIDCGEKSLSTSFQNLAIALKLEDKDKVTLKAMANGAFRILKQWKCLLIYDNAECYIGNEGIKEMLPKSIKNFDVLITSRNKEWGDANGDGEIPQFQMNVFNQNEGVEFMKTHLKVLPNDGHSQIELLCDLLGNLPLALQIAVATLNRHSILSLEKYIDRVKNTPDLLHAKFDSYEKTIDKTMKISLDLIKHFESKGERKIGEIAYRILNIFGFITPDNIPSEFFIAVETEKGTQFQRLKKTLLKIDYHKKANLDEADIDEATGILECYSLITRKSLTKNQYSLNIHRLLQQIIRHNENNSKEHILDQILECDGFLDYKVIPFSYGGKKLQKKYAKIRSQLMDKLKLNELLQDRRIKEAVELARIIYNALKDPCSAFNFAVCLRHNLELKEAEKILEGLLNISINTAAYDEQETFKGYSTQWCTIDSADLLNNNIIIGQLIVIYLHEKRILEATTALLKWKNISLPLLPLNDILYFIKAMSQLNVILKFLDAHQCVKIQLVVEVDNVNEPGNYIELHNFVIDTNTLLPKDFQKLVLNNCTLNAQQNGFISADHVAFRGVKFDFNRNMHPESRPTITSYIKLNERIQKLTFEDIEIDSCTQGAVQGLTMERGEWNDRFWTLDAHFVHQSQFFKTSNFTITEMTLEHFMVDIYILSECLKKLTLRECVVIFTNGYPTLKSIQGLHSLQELSLQNIFVRGQDGKPVYSCNISNVISPSLKVLEVINSLCECLYLCVSLDCLISIQFLHLDGCSLQLVPNIHIAPRELTLKNVRIDSSNNNFLTDVVLNDFVELKQMHIMHITDLTIDFSERFSLKELKLINAKVVNWESGRWIIDKLIVYPYPGTTQMKIHQLVIITDPVNAVKVVKKDKLMTYLKSIAGSKTITGSYLWDNKKAGIEKIHSIAGVYPGILTTTMPTFSDGVERQSFVHDTICDWNNHYLVHVRSDYLGHPLNEILEDRNVTSWIDLIEEGGQKHKVWKKKLDTLALYFHQLQTAGVVPIIDLLPSINDKSKYHLWGGRTGLKGSLKLYQITKDYLTQHHGLNSLIWAWSLDVEGDMTRPEDYWPGTNYVDVVTVYSWDEKELSRSKYQKLLELVGDKPMSMERMWTFPSTELLAAQPRWTWFTAYDYSLTDEKFNSEQNIKKTFESPSVINRENNPFFKNIFSPLITN